MKHMFKQIGVLLGVLALMALMSACGGGAYAPPGSNDGSGNGTNSSTSTTMTPTNSSTSTTSTTTADTAHYTLKLYGTSGNMTVNTGSVTTPTVTASGKKLTVQTDTTNKLYTVNASDIANADVVVVAPASINLDLKEKNGNITITGITGQFKLNVDSGTINVSQSTLTGNSRASANDGALTFKVTLAANSTSELETITKGTIDIALPKDAKFHVEATATTGSITSDFVTIKNPKSVNENVGDATSPVLKLTTKAGYINFHKA